MFITDWLFFVIKIQCVFCEIGTVFKGTGWESPTGSGTNRLFIFMHILMLFLLHKPVRVWCWYQWPTSILKLRLGVAISVFCVYNHHDIMLRHTGASVFYMTWKPPYTWHGGDKLVLVMFSKLKEFGGTLFCLEESVSLLIVHIGPYLVAWWFVYHRLLIIFLVRY